MTTRQPEPGADVSRPATNGAPPTRQRRLLLVMLLLLMLLLAVGLVAYARGDAHHRGDEVGALTALTIAT